MRKILTLTLVLALVLSCFSFSLAENEKAFEPYSEPVTLNVLSSTNSAFWFPEGEDIVNNVLTDYYLERLNIDVISDWSTDEANYAAQIDMMIAGDNLPDMFYATAQQLYRLVQNGQIQPIGKLYDEYASDGVKEALGDSSALYFSQGTVDGEVYGFPQTQDYCVTMPLVWVRADWLEKVGLEKPESWEDYETVMKAFIDQCGATYGIAFNSAAKIGWDAFFNPFDAYYNSWVEKDGEIIHSGITEETREALGKMKEWYEAGYINPEFAMAGNSQTRTNVAEEKVGMFIDIFYPQNSLSELFNANPDIEWIACPIPANADGVRIVEPQITPARYVVVNSDYENPEALIKYMNLWYDMWRGASGEVYHGLNNTDYIEAGENFKFYVPFWFDPPLKNMTHSQILWDIFPDGDITPYEKDYELVKQWNSMHAFLDGDKTQLSGYVHIICYMDGFWTCDNIYHCMDEYHVNAFNGPLSEDYANYKAVADAAMTEYFVSAVMGAKNLDSDWDAFVNTWKSSGGDYMTDYVNEWKAAQ